MVYKDLELKCISFLGKVQHDSCHFCQSFLSFLVSNCLISKYINLKQIFGKIKLRSSHDTICSHETFKICNVMLLL